MSVEIVKAEVYESSDGWRFRAKARNGEIVATGEAYVDAADAIAAARAVCPDGPIVRVEQIVGDDGSVETFETPLR